MIVLCQNIISHTTKENLGDNSPWLKKGKYYKVLALCCFSRDGLSAFIQSEDAGDPVWFSLNGFEIIDQTQPANWITKIKHLPHGESMTRLPAAWDYDSFFEDLIDQEERAMELFISEAKKIYAQEPHLPEQD